MLVAVVAEQLQTQVALVAQVVAEMEQVQHLQLAALQTQAAVVEEEQIQPVAVLVVLVLLSLKSQRSYRGNLNAIVNNICRWICQRIRTTQKSCCWCRWWRNSC
jgi:hypothetical protein